MTARYNESVVLRDSLWELFVMFPTFQTNSMILFFQAGYRTVAQAGVQ